VNSLKFLLFSTLSVSNAAFSLTMNFIKAKNQNTITCVHKMQLQINNS